MSRKWTLTVTAGVVALALACSDSKPSSPVAPSNAPGAADGGDAAADGSTLKVTAPTPTSPANGSRLNDFEVTLLVNAATPKFETGSVPLAYRFELLRGGQAVESSRGTATQWKPTVAFESDTEYGWRVRAEQGTAFGPWSATWTFRTPEQPRGYNIPGELYDPLYTGDTVGTPIGSTAFVPGVGIRLNEHTSHVEYVLPQTIPEGELSMLVTNTPANTEGGKTKIMSMREGRSDITTNDRRFTIEKRGDPPGIIAFRVITRDSQEETQGAERVSRNFQANRWYLWRASFRGGRFQLEIFEDGANGNRIYSFGKNYEGLYDPNPHLAYIGAPVGRGGPADATVPGMIAKQVWLSSRPRPAFANK
jgi:hypothetical protein